MKILSQVCEIAMGPFFSPFLQFSRSLPLLKRCRSGGTPTKRLEELLFTEKMSQALEYWEQEALSKLVL